MALLATATLLVLVESALSTVRYEQGQTGDYNVHLDLKNIEVLAFLDGSALGINDYDYDYGDYTLKPPSANSTASNGFAASNNSTSNSTTSTVSNGVNSTDSTSGNFNSSIPLISQQADGVKEETSSEAATESTTTKPVRRCGAGFYRDPAGRCRRLRRPIKLSGILQQAKNRISGK